MPARTTHINDNDWLKCWESLECSLIVISLLSRQFRKTRNYSAKNCMRRTPKSGVERRRERNRRAIWTMANLPMPKRIFTKMKIRPTKTNDSTKLNFYSESFFSLSIFCSLPSFWDVDFSIQPRTYYVALRPRTFTTPNPRSLLLGCCSQSHHTFYGCKFMCYVVPSCRVNLMP